MKLSAVIGFNEMYGKDLEYRDLTLRILIDNTKKFKYKQIQIPILEPAASFSEEVIGKSPWPEWNKRGCFYLTINDYFNDYESCEQEDLILIPEGTVSVTRWLGESISAKNIDFPIKLYYNTSCYRNELIDTLSVLKRREFIQFGMEIIGSRHIHSDTEIILLICKNLEALGINLSSVRVRLNDIEIFNKLIKESKITGDDVIKIKELLDTLAEAKAGKGEERYTPTKKQLLLLLGKYQISDIIMTKWNAIINQTDYRKGNIGNIFGQDYRTNFDVLEEMQNVFAKIGIQIALDFCVIRSHEYYTSISFEVDVLEQGKKFIEIAGGGRYDKLVSSFVDQKCPIKQVPSTGFAFGVERLVDMLKKLKVFNDCEEICSRFDFNGTGSLIYPANDSIQAYIDEFLKIEKTKSINIFVGKI